MRSFLLLFFPILFFSCMPQTYDVQSVCEVTDLYNYIVKWEVAPDMEGQVEIFSSNDPGNFDMDRPVAIENISKGRADIVIKGSLNRLYFLLQFNDEVRTIVGVRSQNFSSVENFRDIGGYVTLDKHKIKWGKLYRSGNLDSINNINAKRVRNMNVRTYIDFRTDSHKETLSPITGIKQYYHLPVIPVQKNPISLIMEHRFKRGDAIIYMQDVNREMILKCTDSFRQMFKLLEEEDNYPVILGCRYGISQTSIAVALVLIALDVPEQTIIEDYLLSNKYFNMRKVASIAWDMPLETQDAITSMMISDECYLMSAIDLIKSKYGSMDEYLSKELGVDEDCKKKLRAILLN